MDQDIHAGDGCEKNWNISLHFVVSSSRRSVPCHSLSTLLTRFPGTVYFTYAPQSASHPFTTEPQRRILLALNLLELLTNWTPVSLLFVSKFPYNLAYTRLGWVLYQLLRPNHCEHFWYHFDQSSHRFTSLQFSSIASCSTSAKWTLQVTRKLSDSVFGNFGEPLEDDIDDTSPSGGRVGSACLPDETPHQEPEYSEYGGYRDIENLESPSTM